jgi:predicted nucleic acid-binding protein
MILLDTGVLSIWLNTRERQEAPRLVAFVDDLIRSEGLSISYVSVYELRRGIEELQRKQQGQRKRVRLEKVLNTSDILGLDNHLGWDAAASLWADGRIQKPAVVIEDADLPLRFHMLVRS